MSSLVADPEPSDNDQDIRDFLEDLSVEIENNYAVARSGRIATYSGIWICTTLPTEHVQLTSGQTLPDIGNTEVVWMYKTRSPETAEDIIRDEFRTYYIPRTVWGSPEYMEPDEHAECSLERLSKNTTPNILPSLLRLLKEMESNREHPLTKRIEMETGSNWTKEDTNWMWYTSLLTQIRKGLAASVDQ
ncbi:hypothetical protein ACFQUU_06895 [Herbaspirillum sp. GCM10030257]|uniref:hypothetical protein n=1 Tax=Herbaspirillum sp. GCM10030257 TaxID=3273393 RepID=UPI003620C835